MLSGLDLEQSAELLTLCARPSSSLTVLVPDLATTHSFWVPTVCRAQNHSRILVLLEAAESTILEEHAIAA